MAKVYMFPEKKKLPKNLEKRLCELAKDYIELVYAIAVVMGVEDADGPEYDEVTELIAEAFAKGLEDAIEEMEKDS